MSDELPYDPAQDDIHKGHGPVHDIARRLQVVIREGTPIEKVLASRHRGHDIEDGERVQLRAIPDELMHAAGKQYRDTMGLLERVHEALTGWGVSLDGLDDEIAAVLRANGRPYPNQQYGERYYDPPPYRPSDRHRAEYPMDAQGRDPSMHEPAAPQALWEACVAARWGEWSEEAAQHRRAFDAGYHARKPA